MLPNIENINAVKSQKFANHSLTRQYIVTGKKHIMCLLRNDEVPLRMIKLYRNHEYYSSSRQSLQGKLQSVKNAIKHFLVYVSDESLYLLSRTRIKTCDGEIPITVPTPKSSLMRCCFYNELITMKAVKQNLFQEIKLVFNENY